MSEYVDITKDYIHRCLENYIKFNEETQFNVTLAITTLQAVSMAFVSQCDSKPYSETSFLKEISSEISTLFENNQSFKTGRCNYQHWNNIRNAFSHMMEKNVEIFPNKEKEIEKIRFKCDAMKNEQVVSVKDLYKFLTDLYKIVNSYKNTKTQKC